MGRPKANVSETKLLSLREQGKTLGTISQETGVSVPTISRRIAELENEQGILTKYRQLQGLRLTALQFKILEAITPEKIQKATLYELTRCYEIIQKAQETIDTQNSPKNMSLVDLLAEMEQNPAACRTAS